MKICVEKAALWAVEKPKSAPSPGPPSDGPAKLPGTTPLAAAQLFAAARRANPGLLAAIGKGDFSPLLAWLRANVHGKGSLESTDQVLVEATGDRLGTAAFKAHLETRYLSA